MKRLLYFIIFVILFFFTCGITIAQEISICKLIGKSTNEVIRQYGKPIHQDMSNPAMQCMFYKTKDYQLVFVANKEGVYQAEGNLSYGSKRNAGKAITGFLSDCGEKGMKIDTVNADEFNVDGDNFKMNIVLFQNTSSNKYEIKVKANRSGG